MYEIYFILSCVYSYQIIELCYQDKYMFDLILMNHKYMY